MNSTDGEGVLQMCAEKIKQWTGVEFENDDSADPNEKEWEAIQWSRLDSLLGGRFVMPSDYRMLQGMDEQPCGDEELQTAVASALLRKKQWDDLIDQRRAIIKKFTGKFIADRDVYNRLVENAYDTDIVEQVKRELQTLAYDEDSEVKKKYISHMLGDYSVGRANFAKLMDVPAEHLDKAIKDCPKFPKEKKGKEKRQTGKLLPSQLAKINQPWVKTTAVRYRPY